MELMDEDSDKTERVADALAQTKTVKRRRTPIPNQVQMGKYNASDTVSFKQVDESGDPYADTGIIDIRSEKWRSHEVRATPAATEHRVTIREVEDLSHTAQEPCLEKPVGHIH